MFANQQGHQLVEDGDTVILYSGKFRITHLAIKKGERLINRFGAFKHDDIIGKPYGSRIYATNKKGMSGFSYILKPTNPDIWCVGPLEHQTQIIYPLDISQICFHLELSPGKRVIESGTGSGSLSLGFARCLYPTGRLDTFEFHAERAASTKEHFKTLGLDKVIHSNRRDVISDGFDVPDSCADAVFLDLPAPWKVVQEANRVLKVGGNFCSFSPCIEQIQKTADAVRENGFEDLRVIECLLRTHEVSKRDYEALNMESRIASDRDLGLPPVAAKVTPSVVQPVAAESGALPPAAPVAEVKAEDIKKEGTSEVKAEPMDESEDSLTGSKRKHEELGIKEEPTTAVVVEDKPKRFTSRIRHISKITNNLASRPTAEAKGHTSYLLFARKSVPLPVATEQAATAPAVTVPATEPAATVTTESVKEETK